MANTTNRGLEVKLFRTSDGKIAAQCLTRQKGHVITKSVAMFDPKPADGREETVRFFNSPGSPGTAVSSRTLQQMVVDRVEAIRLQDGGVNGLNLAEPCSLFGSPDAGYTGRPAAEIRRNALGH
ncbi:MAG: hypothetical protein HY519_03485 [Candidatus Aenigmarchaeota archaeon]|nr:hypothetical protein [Candidatus Aenigmarchaeota archaeon]